jgi:F0F1-type ATP synthase membrane subunit b/b'
MNSARLARRWQEAGGDYAQMAEALNDEITVELATKSDLRALESALKTEIAELSAEFRTEIADLRTELRTELGSEIGGVRTELARTRGGLEGKIESAKAEIIKWVAGMMLVHLVAVVGLVRLPFVP